MDKEIAENSEKTRKTKNRLQKWTRIKEKENIWKSKPQKMRLYSMTKWMNKSSL